MQFVEELQKRLKAAAAAQAAAAQGPGAMFLSQSHANLAGVGGGGDGMGGGGGGIALSSISAAHEELPFELRALEIGLDTVSQYLERLTGDLEAAAHPALDALTGKVGGWGACEGWVEGSVCGWVGRWGASGASLFVPAFPAAVLCGTSPH